MRLEASSLTVLPPVHPNRLPFRGTLCRLGIQSDAAPSGSNGRRIIVTYAAAARALDSLIGQGVNVKTDQHGRADFHGHQPATKCGIINEAKIVGDAIEISGHLWASDMPAIAAAIRERKADLGLSFEARDVIADAGADPMVITGMCFSGASILLRNEAAFTSTSLAAAAAKAHVKVHPVLLRALTRAGFSECEDPEDRLSTRQLATLMDQAGSIQARIELKQLVGEAQIWPKEG